jgi:hypothetical protein
VFPIKIKYEIQNPNCVMAMKILTAYSPVLPKLDNFEYGSNYTTQSSFDISTTENSSLSTPLTSTMTTHSTVTTTNSNNIIIGSGAATRSFREGAVDCCTILEISEIFVAVVVDINIVVSFELFVVVTVE